MDRFAAMEAFVVALEAGSFSAAAKRLGVGQPAVSKTVAQLEDSLGVRLLLRSTRGLRPTEAGQNYYAFARRAIEEAEQAEIAARNTNSGLTGKLRISAAVTFARLHVVPQLRTLLDAHPGLRLDVILDDRDIDLVEQGIDVALRMGALPDSSLTARLVAQGRRSVVGTPSYFAARGIPQTPADLVHHEVVVHQVDRSGAAWTFERSGSPVSVKVQGRLHVTAAEGVRAAVLAGMGLTVASDWMFAPELASGAVVRVLTDWTLAPLDLWAVFPAGRRVSAKSRAFVDHVQSTLAAGAAAHAAWDRATSAAVMPSSARP